MMLIIKNGLDSFYSRNNYYCSNKIIKIIFSNSNKDKKHMKIFTMH